MNVRFERCGRLPGIPCSPYSFCQGMRNEEVSPSVIEETASAKPTVVLVLPRIKNTVFLFHRYCQGGSDQFSLKCNGIRRDLPVLGWYSHVPLP